MIKKNWNELDFKKMSWHDCRLYGFNIDYYDDEPWRNKLSLNLDYYVFNKKLSDDIATPAILEFRSFSDLVIKLNYQDDIFEGLEIVNVVLKKNLLQENGVLIYCWKIELRNGFIELNSLGFNQFLRC